MNLDLIIPAIVTYAESLTIPVVLMVLGILHVIGLAYESIMLAVESFVEKTPTKEDDEKLASLKQHKIFKIVATVCNIFVRLKLKK